METKFASEKPSGKPIKTVYGKGTRKIKDGRGLEITLLNH
jgi:hypothetical protein